MCMDRGKINRAGCECVILSKGIGVLSELFLCLFVYVRDDSQMNSFGAPSRLVNGAWDFGSWGPGFEPHTGHREYSQKMKNKQKALLNHSTAR